MGNQLHLLRTQSIYCMYILQVRSVCSTGAIQYVQATAVFCLKYFSYMVANGPVAYAESIHGGRVAYSGHLYLVCAICDVAI